MKTLDYPWDIFMGVSCPNQDAFGRRAQDLAVARDSFASPPRGTSLVLGAIRPSPHAGPLSGSGPAPPGRPARPALNVCLAWTPFCIPKLGGHTRRQTHTHRRTKRCRFFPPALAPTRPGLPCVYTHTSLDLTALDPYGDQNTPKFPGFFLTRVVRMRTLVLQTRAS